MPAHLVQIVKDPLKKENTDTNFQLLQTYSIAKSSLSSAKQFLVASKAQVELLFVKTEAQLVL